MTSATTESLNATKYKYSVSNPTWIRIANLWGLVSLVPVIFGYTQFLQLSIFYVLFFGPLIAVNVVSNVFSRFINVFLPKFDPTEHQKFVKDFWTKNKRPSVDILLPIAGEPIEILEKTWQAVKNIEYNNYKVYVLDDKDSAEAQALAKKFEFKYLVRPNRGQYKKAGNIEYGYEQSSGEFVLVLDADFVPIPEALTEALPYIISKPKMSILQTPQYFEASKTIHNQAPIAYGAATVVEEFYRVTQPAKSLFGLSICVGTSAIYRREAVELSGVPRVDHTEDVKQGLLTMAQGYHVGYLPLIISQGICPDDIQTYYSQQLRWAYGSIETVFSKFFNSAKLNFWGKLNFITSGLYYIVEATAPLLSLQLLALLYFNTESLKLSWVLPFVPFLIYEIFIKPSTQISKARYGTRLAGLTQMFTYLEGLIRFVFGKDIVWQSTNQKGAKQQIKTNYFTNSIITLIFSSTYCLLLSIIIGLKPYILFNFETYIVLFLALYRAYIYLDYTKVMLQFMHVGMITDLENKIVKAFHFHSWRVISIGLIAISLVTLLGSIGFNIWHQLQFNPHFADKLLSLK